MSGRHRDRSAPRRVVVAGHICLDLIPGPAGVAREGALRPGALDLIGPLTTAVGGCVGNVGFALWRLGLRPTLVARVGDDPLGTLLVDLVHRVVPAESTRLTATPGGSTSYSLIVNRPGRDRSIRHFSGVNDTFVSADVPDDLLAGASLLHVGYPPLMAAMLADDGRELGRLLERARCAGAMTSMDLANPRRDPLAGRDRWRRLLARVLPATDVFMPSLDEACHLLGRRVTRDGQGAPELGSVARLAEELIDLGAAIAGLKLGAHGLYVRTAPLDRLPAGLAAPGAGPAAPRAGALDPWAGRELYSAVFESHVVGTTGAGDATIAGFLFGLLTGRSPEEAVTAACAIGGSSTEATDGTSGVPAWPEIERRLAAGWRRRAEAPGQGWTTSGGGPWVGPRDRVAGPRPA